VSSCAKFCLRELLWNLLPQQEVAKKEFLNNEIAKISERGVPVFTELTGTQATAIWSHGPDQVPVSPGSLCAPVSKFCLRELLRNLLPQREVAKKEFLNKKIAKISEREFQALPSCHPVQKRRPFGLMVRIKYQFLRDLCALLFQSSVFVSFLRNLLPQQEVAKKEFLNKEIAKISEREFQVLPSCHPVQKQRPFGLMVRIKYRFLCSLCELLFKVLSS
jgi:Trp operon repressor